MKIISKNLLMFIALITLFTLIFRMGLSRLLDAERYSLVIALSVLYGLLMAASGWFTGRMEGRQNFFFDAGFRWSLSTFVIWGGMSYAWFFLGRPASVESVQTVHVTLLIWSVFLVLHLLLFLILRRRTIKGVHKGDIFE